MTGFPLRSRRRADSNRLDERGSSLVALVVVAPIVVMALLVIVQVMIAAHVRHVLSLAASAGVAEAAALDGSAALGEQRALDQLVGATGWVIDPQVTASRSGTQATVTAAADAYQMLPVGDWHIAVERTSPVERVD